MKIFLLSILAIGGVQSLTIGHPYRSGYWAYNPARGEFPVQSSVVQSYLRYIDNNGNERIISYSYPEPVYGQHQISYVGDVSNPVQYRTSTQNEFGEFNKARDAHFRVWSLQQYQVLKREIDALRAQGKEPSADMLLKFLPLEKIALTDDYTTIAHLPEIKRIREEHLQIWNNARVQNLQTNAAGTTTYQQSNIGSNQGDLKTFSGQPSTTLVNIEETPEQKQAREEHLRIYNEQIASLRQLELEHQKQQQKQNVNFSLRTSQLEQKPVEQQTQYTGAISELERAKQEHFRLWNEAKLRAEQSNVKFQGVKDITNKENEAADKDKISALKHDQIAQYQHDAIQATADIQKAREDQLHLISDAREDQLRLISDAREDQLRLISDATLRVQAAAEQYKQIEQQRQQQPIVDTPDVIKAREEHLRLVNEAKLRVEQAEQAELKHKQQQPIEQPEKATAFELRSQQQQDNAEHVKAREEHSRLVNEAKLKIQAAEEYIKQLGAQQVTPGQSQTESQYGHEQQQSKSSTFGEQQHQVVDTPEIIKAREEHLRLVNEAKLRVEQAEQQELKHTSQDIKQPTQLATTVTDVKLGTEQQDSADHLKTLEEHLRLVNEATLRIQKAEDHIKQLSAQQVTPGQIQTQSRFGYEQQQLKYAKPVNQQQHQVVDTPEVIKAREEHLRLVNEANVRAQNVEQQELKYKQQNKQESHQVPLLRAQVEHQPIYHQQHQQVHLHEQSKSIQDTHAAINAREQHLRLINEPKFSDKSGDQNIQYHTEQQSNLKSYLPEEYQQHQINQQIFDIHHHHIADTPEVQKAREEHLRIFNAVKSHNEQEESKMAGFIKSNEQQLDKITEEEQRLLEERRILELQGLREAEILQGQQQKLEYEGMREAERLAEEQRQIEAELQRLKIEEQKRLELENMLEAKRLAEEQRQMEAELQRLKSEEEQRLEMERISEAKHLKEEQEELQRLEESSQTKVQDTLALKQTESSNIPSTKSVGQTQSQQVVSQHQQQYVHNPYLRANAIESGAANRLQHSFNQQQQYAYVNNPFFKTAVLKTPIVYYPVTDISSSSSAVKSSTIIPVVRYVQSSQPSTGNKQQHIKEDFVKTKYSNTAGSQPADTAVALIALERATNEHFRAHELALEQLRLARLQNPNFKDCN